MTATRGNAAAWIIFLASLLVLSLAATSYWRIADQAMIAIRLTLIVLISIAFVRSRWRHRDDDTPRDRGDSLILRLRRWYYGDEEK